MAVKVYLSPAAHENDHACAAETGCSENTHANRYLDELIPYLDACGILWKRNGTDKTGSAAVRRAVKESNAWGADLHYVVHTNAFNGTVAGSRPMVYPTGEGAAWAETLARWRRQIYPYAVSPRTRTDLYEINQSRAVCLYEELVFHDNPVDARWLHEHMRQLAEYTARAFCEIFHLRFTDPYAALPGDVDGDGKLTSTDARLALQYSVGKIDGEGLNMALADVDGDGKVTSTDARLILQGSVGKIDWPPKISE